MNTWKKLLRAAITDGAALARHLDISKEEVDRVGAIYPMRINPYYLELIQRHGSPLYRQAVPDIRELQDQTGMADPLGEEAHSPVPNLIHRYPDRALLLVCNECAMYCRFCTRKRKVGRPAMQVSAATIKAGLDYLARTPQIREVLLSGGDPLLLDDHVLEDILRAIRTIKTIEVIRIGSRLPCTLPMRITPRLVRMLRRYHPLYLNTHFNHPDEITPEATAACTLLADGGIPLGCQTVLLRGVNDNPATMQALLRKLLAIRVRPYYLFQTDLTRGTEHFRTPVSQGLAIVKELIGNLSGMALPTFAVDAPGGGGKTPLLPDIIQYTKGGVRFTNFQGKTCFYPDPKTT